MKLTKRPSLPNCQLQNGFFVKVYNYSAFGYIYFCVSFSHERKSERIERKLKHKIRSIVEIMDPKELDTNYLDKVLNFSMLILFLVQSLLPVVFKTAWIMKLFKPIT